MKSACGIVVGLTSRVAHEVCRFNLLANLLSNILQLYCCLQPVKLIIWVADVCLDVRRQTFFQTATPLTVFFQLLVKLGTHDLCTSMQKHYR